MASRFYDELKDLVPQQVLDAFIQDNYELMVPRRDRITIGHDGWRISIMVPFLNLKRSTLCAAGSHTVVHVVE